jgi:hypothetical protein
MRRMTQGSSAVSMRIFWFGLAAEEKSESIEKLS